MHEKYVKSDTLSAPHKAGNAYASPIQPDTTAEQLGAISYKFVFCEHTYENADRIASELQDCNIVALEAVGLANQAERSQLSNRFTRYVSSDPTSEEREYVETYLANWKKRVEDPINHKFNNNALLFESLLTQFAGSDKQIVLTDMDADHPDYPLLTQWNELNINGVNKALSTTHKVQNVRQTAEQSFLTLAYLIKVRENIVVSQLQNLGSNHPGATVGVMAGNVHTRVQHQMAKRAPTQRVFAHACKVMPPGVKQMYAPALSATRALIFDTAKPINPEMLDRLVLSSYFTRYVTRNEHLDSLQPGANDAQSEVADYADVVDNMSDAYVADLLGQIDQIPISDKVAQRLVAANHLSRLLKEAADWMGAIEDGEIPGVQQDSTK